jgi:hypothetical protein
MRKYYNIAAGMKFRPAFMDVFKGVCAENNMQLLGACIVDGPGCRNLALMFEDPNATPEMDQDEDGAAKTVHSNTWKFVYQVTMQLQPAKFNECGPDPQLVEGVFEDRSTFGHL